MSERYDISLITFLLLILIGGVFIAFLIVPVFYVFVKAFYINGHFSLRFFQLMFENPIMREAIMNSIKIGVATTIATTILSLPLAFLMIRFDFPFKSIVQGLILVPMIMPPFVGAIGMKQFFARYGAVNLLLMKIGLVDKPIDWFGDGGFTGIIILEVLHLYPIMYLNVAAALANVDPSLEEAAENMGAGRFKLFRSVTFPLMIPGYFAGAIIIFLWAITDLGTPLIFAYRKVIPVQIFNMVTDIHENPMGSVLVVFVLMMTVFFFYISKVMVGTKRYEMFSRGHIVPRSLHLSWFKAIPLYLFFFFVFFLAVIPHISVVITSISQKWFMSILPQEVTLKYYGLAFTHPLTSRGIANSLLYSVFSTTFDIFFGVLIAYLLTRKRIPWKNVIDTLAMLPLALPGLVLAFGYVATYSGTALDPRENPVPLLIISYGIRRLPYAVRAAYAGFQRTSIALEEASLNLGASVSRTVVKITLPLIMANLIAGGLLCFAYAMMEVSDSMVLAMKEQFYPITKAIWSLFGRLGDGAYISSALGIIGMILLTASILVASKILGQKMGELFRA
ncbi:MAG: iron ABC transporter permease [Candidatus Tectomicrobia bacterium]|nr:iron ABC transporter permease [Candidatus Tectomicrobia bacterium]